MDVGGGCGVRLELTEAWHGSGLITELNRGRGWVPDGGGCVYVVVGEESNGGKGVVL